MSVEEQLKEGLAGAYEIERELGGGGMSRVFVATEISLGRRVVIKVLPPDMTVSLGAERFKQEMRVTASLQHPHIVPVLSSGSVGDLLYYTMPFVEGESLRARLSRQGRMAIADAESIVRDLLDALAYAHRQGIVHRDIKPDNILLTDHGALVTDFGIAKPSLRPSSKTISIDEVARALTSTGMALGTVDYMAPEQLAADPSGDHRIDLFATGLVLHECLTGALPFAEMSPQTRLAAVMTQTAVHVQMLRKDVPPKLDAFIDLCLRRDRAERPVSATAALALLDGPAPRQSWTRPAIAAAIAFVLIILAGWAVTGPLRAPLATARRIVSRPDAAVQSGRIIVAPFEAIPDDDATRALGGMIADYIAQGLSVVPRVEVVDSRTAMINAEVVDRIPRVLRAGDRAIALAREVGAGVLIAGHVRIDGDSVRADAVVIDAQTQHIRQSLGTVAAARGATSELVDAMRRRAVAAVIQASDTTLRVDYGTLSTPPSLDAYTWMRLGLKQLLSRDTAAIATLQVAARMDSAWVTPRLFLVLAAGNDARFAVADSALASIRGLLDRATPAERALYEVNAANYRADREAALSAGEALLRASPGSTEAQLVLIAEALYAGHVRRAFEVSNTMDPDRGINLGSPFFWRYRAVTLLRMGDAPKALEAATAGEKAFGRDQFGGLIVQALAAAKRADEARVAIDNYAGEAVFVRRDDLIESAAMQLWRAGDQDGAKRLAGWGSTTLPAASPARMRLAVLAGDESATAAALKRLRADSVTAGAPGKFDFGTHEYRRAQIAMLGGEPDRAVRLLEEAKRRGYPFNNVEGFRPHLDPLFAALHGYPPFEKLVEHKDH